MCRLLESIKITSRGIENVDFHNERFNNARLKIFGLKHSLDLSDFIQLPALKESEIIKCRVVYREDIIKIEYISYKKKDIKTLKAVYDNEISYEFKFEDRRHLNQLYSLRQACDDVLIIKHGMVTDFSYGNIVFYDGRQWMTPREPLLRGTMRESLIRAKKIIERDIPVNNLRTYKSFKLINAMFGFDDAERPIENIIT